MSPVLYGRVKIVWNAWPRNEKYFRHSCQVFNNPHPCKFLPLIVPRRFPKFIFSRLWPPPIPHSVSCELIRKILKKVREREKEKWTLSRLLQSWSLKIFVEKNLTFVLFVLFRTRKILSHVSNENLKKGGNTACIIFLDLSLFQRSRDSFPRHATHQGAWCD